ncbi:MAG: hypothetical protein JWM14_1350 [Chitinophagaceae bacterium]|nr:hypothetical protein [Chitinophagaceae bacterium]
MSFLFCILQRIQGQDYCLTTGTKKPAVGQVRKYYNQKAFAYSSSLFLKNFFTTLLKAFFVNGFTT